jgi:putative NADH-flavin reductase
MRLFVLGATGRTGVEILELARARGHEITAFVRSPQKIVPFERLRVVAGDPRKAEALQAALPGHDAVLSAIGPAPRDAFNASTLLTDCAAATVAAMAAAGVSRLAIVSAALLFPEKGPLFSFVRWLLRHHVQDLRTMEAAITSSPLAWTIVRPPRLVKSPDADYRAEPGRLPAGRRVVPFRSVAAFMLDAIERGEYVREMAGLSR